MKKRYFVFAVLIIVMGSLIVYRISKNNSVANSSDKGISGKGGKKAAMRVNGVVVKAQKFANSISLKGSIEPNEQVQIRSQVSGIIDKIYFKEGSNVKKGQVLLEIDASELRAQLMEALTKEKLASETAQRSRLLLAKEAISQEEYEVAEAGLKSLQAQTQIIQAQLAKTTIRAPFSGKIGLRSVSEGGYLSSEMIVANLVSSDPVKITFSVPEKYSSLIKINTDLTFTVLGSAKIYKGNLYAIEPQIDVATRTLQLRARAENRDGTLYPGSFANVTLPLAIIDDALLVPTESIVPIQNGKKVFIAENNKAKEVMVKTSTRTGKDIMVTSGLKAGDTILTTGIMSLKEGTSVKVSIEKNNKL